MEGLYSLEPDIKLSQQFSEANLGFGKLKGHNVGGMPIRKDKIVNIILFESEYFLQNKKALQLTYVKKAKKYYNHQKCQKKI